MKKAIIMLLTVTTLLSCFTIFSSAEDAEITPRYSNVNSANVSFAITETGLAAVDVSYFGKPGITTQVKSEIYLQKKVLGLFWQKVNIGTTDNVWIDYSTNCDGGFFHSFQLSDTGTYRAVVEITFSGTGGTPDVISDKYQDNW